MNFFIWSCFSQRKLQISVGFIALINAVVFPQLSFGISNILLLHKLGYPLLSHNAYLMYSAITSYL